MKFFSVFVSLMTYLGYVFLKMSIIIIFTIIDNEKEENINSSIIFEGFYLKLRRKFRKFNNNVDSLYLEYSKKYKLHTFRSLIDVHPSPPIKISVFFHPGHSQV